MSYHHFTSHVRSVRLRKGYQQLELARKAGVSLSVVQKIEYGHAPTLDTAMRIAQALSVPIEKLWQFKERS